MLPEIVKAVEGRCEVYLDGGVRQGSDVLKALALGAQAVFLGRPSIYALAYDVKPIWTLLGDGVLARASRDIHDII